MIPESFIQELLARVDIVEVVGRYVRLRKGGANLLGLCPFHSEKTASFTVSPSKQFYHCFGCGAHGNAIHFLTEHTGASFPEAVRSLAASVGLSVPEAPRSPAQRQAQRERRDANQRQREILQQAYRHYCAALRQAPEAIDYLKGRGVTGKMAAHFGLGWASSARRGLSAVFPHYDEAALLESGLVLESDEGARYDRFRGRVMFPIRNGRGQLVGFGGRLIRAGEPKYLNSPETALFSKGRELYGLHEARAGIRAEGCVLVVEGYMDVVMLAQHGLANAVATLGTATTADHLKMLCRASERIVFSFDGDAAGRRAAWRALEACLPWAAENVAMHFLFLPPEHDPDSYVRAEGADALRARIGEAAPLSRFLLDELARRHPLEEAEGRTACVHEAGPLLALVPASLFRTQLEAELARQVRMTPEELSAWLSEAAESGRGRGYGPASESRLSSSEPAEAPRQATSPQAAGESSFPHEGATRRQAAGNPARRADSRRQPARGGTQAARAVTPMARRLLRLLLAHPQLVARLGDQQLELLAHHPHLHLVRELVGRVSAMGATHAGAILQSVDPESDLALALQDLSTQVFVQDLPNPQAEWDDALHTIERQMIQAQCDRLIASGLSDDEQRRRYQDLSRRLAQLKATPGTPLR